MSANALIIGSCILWVLICARLWWMVGSKHAWQRHLIAIGAGLGAALIYVFGSMLTSVVSMEKKPANLPASGEDIRVSPGVPKKP